MSKIKYVGFKDLPRRRPDEPPSPPKQEEGPGANVAESVTVEESAIANLTTVAEPSIEIPAIVKSATVASPPVAPVQTATVEESTTVAGIATLRHVPGYTSVENTVLDSLAEAIPPTQYAVFLRLYRLSRGFKKETCTVGLERLAKSVCVSKRTVQDALDRLRALGLVERVREGRTKNDASEYRVIVPVTTVAKSSIAKSAMANPAIVESARNRCSPANTLI
jgi:hypothetical protein